MYPHLVSETYASTRLLRIFVIVIQMANNYKLILVTISPYENELDVSLRDSLSNLLIY